MLSRNLSQQLRCLLRSACGVVFLAAVSFGSAISSPAARAGQGLEIAVALPLTGDESSFGQGSLQGIQLAIEEANADGAKPPIALTIYDDRSRDDEAKAVAGQIVRSHAALVLGPALSTASLAAGPVYGMAGLASLTTTATSDLITKNSTTFRLLFRNSEQGVVLATYLVRVLGNRRATVIVVDNEYGHSLRAGFDRAARRLGIKAQYFMFTTVDEAEQMARRVAAQSSQPPIVLLTLDSHAARILTTLRRLGARGPFLGGDALGDESFSRRFADLPEERQHPGYFTDGVYGLSPMILDSANADILIFAERFRRRFGHEPIWFNAAGYDAARLATATLRAVSVSANLEPRALRAAVLRYLLALNGPAQAFPGLLSPIWFDEARGRQLAIRIGRYYHGRLESAPLQIVPVTTPDAAEIGSGAVFEMDSGRYARLQRVVYTGVFINDVPRVDVAGSSFSADFYLWLRFARNAGPGSTDPIDIDFPTLLSSGSFDRTRPAEQRAMADGTEYRLWRIQGEFRNDFELRRFPFDRQVLSIPFFNARADMDDLVYVVDARASADERTRPPSPAISRSAMATQPTPGTPAIDTGSIASLAAFRNLTQWNPLRAHARRENLVTASALGDPTHVGVAISRELSGFVVTVELLRRTTATLAKTLIPLLLMTMVMYVSLYFPVAWEKEKVTVAITSMLSGAVLLTAINNQLGGNIGYIIAIEYVFYVFFGLSLLCTVSALGAERLRAAGRGEIASRSERCTRTVFLLAIAGTVVGVWWLYGSR